MKLAAQSPVPFYDFARLIVELHDADPTTFRGLAKPLRMSLRKLYYLLQVGRLIEAHAIAKADVEEVGWTKLQIIAKYVTGLEDPNEIDLRDLFKLAAKITCHSLPQALSGGRMVAKRSVVFRLSMGARVELNDALLAFGAQRSNGGLKNKDRALIRMVRAATTGIA